MQRGKPNTPDPEKQAIKNVIDQIWDTYDTAKSGALNKANTKKFVEETLGNLGSGDEFSDKKFNEVFANFEDSLGNFKKLSAYNLIMLLVRNNETKNN